LRSQLSVVVVVGRLGAASSRLSVDSPKLRFGAAAEIASGSSRSVEEGGRFEAELGLTTTVGDMTEEVVGGAGAARGATTGEKLRARVEGVDVEEEVVEGLRTSWSATPK